MRALVPCIIATLVLTATAVISHHWRWWPWSGWELASLRTRLKRNRRPGLGIIITLEAAQLELQKIESMTTSIPLERDRDLKRRWYRLLQRAVPSGVPAGDRPIAVRYSGYPVVTLRPIEGLEFVKETFAGSSPPTRKIDGLVAVKVEKTRARLWSWFAAPMSPCITLPVASAAAPPGLRADVRSRRSSKGK